VTQSSRQTVVPEGQKTVAHGFNRGLSIGLVSSPGGTKENLSLRNLPPLRGLIHFGLVNPRLKPWANFDRASGAISRITQHASHHHA